MKQIKLSLLTLIAGAAIFGACTKSSNNVATKLLQIGQTIKPGTPLCGAVKGTMTAGNVYTVSCPINVNKGDTLLIQNGVTVNFTHRTDTPVGLSVQGVLISLGTKANPVTMTVSGVTRTDNPTASVATDPAYQGQWVGIECDTMCPLLVLKWTHINFAGQSYTNAPIPSAQANKCIVYQNPNGLFVMEDSWIYGGVDDAVRLQGGKVYIVRNTVEKASVPSGDVFNAKHGTVGIMAYNFFIGACTNGTKASDKGTYTGPTCRIDMYNNTYVNCGYRQTQSGRGGCLNYEQSSFGQYYNNLMVNCRFGPRVVPNPPADTIDMHYGYSFQYGDQDSVCNQFYPVGYITHPQTTDIPAPATLITNYSAYFLGATYTNAGQAKQNNPKFVNYPLPDPNGVSVAYVPTGADFHLGTGSPALGKGYTGWTPYNPGINVDANYGATDIIAPGKDMGCYQADGTGNQH